MKKILFAPLILAITLLSLSFSPVAAAQEDLSEVIHEGLCSGANLEFNERTEEACEVENNAMGDITAFIRRIVNFLSILVGIVAVIMIIVGGFRYVTSGGSDASVTGAKNTILYAVIGLIIVALAQLIVNFVLRNLANVA